MANLSKKNTHRCITIKYFKTSSRTITNSVNFHSNTQFVVGFFNLRFTSAPVSVVDEVVRAHHLNLFTFVSNIFFSNEFLITEKLKYKPNKHKYKLS